MTNRALQIKMSEEVLEDREIEDKEIEDKETRDSEGEAEIGREIGIEIEEGIEQTKEAYLFSVKFFLDLYRLIYAMLFFLPLILCIIFGIKLWKAGEAEQELRQKFEVIEYEIQASREVAAENIQIEKEEMEVSDQKDTEHSYIDPSYTGLYPDFYAPEAALSSVDPLKTCYLTFDDGPSERTEEILEILDKEGVHGTFFVTKQDSRENRQRLLKTAEAGHTIGMHTASHRYATIYSSVESFLADYYELYSWIREVTGETPTIYRFPGGSINGYNRGIYQEIIAEMSRRGFVYFDWNVSSGDSAPATLTSAQIVENCLNEVEKLKCAVILMHDSEEKNITVNALADVIQGYRDNGYAFGRLTPEVTPVIFHYPD